MGLLSSEETVKKKVVSDAPEPAVKTSQLASKSGPKIEQVSPSRTVGLQAPITTVQPLAKESPKSTSKPVVPIPAKSAASAVKSRASHSRRIREDLPEAFDLVRVGEPTGETLVDFALHGSITNVPDGAKYGLELTTRTDHIEVITQCAKILSDSERKLPLVKAVIKALEKLRIKRGWRWTTTSTKCGSVAGGLARASSYVPSINDFALRDLAVWKDYISRIEKAKKLEIPANVAAEASADQVFASVSSNPDRLALLPLLAWVGGGQRFDSISLLKTTNIQIQGNNLSMRFEDGKTIKATGPYTIKTSVPKEFEPRIRDLLEKREQHVYLFFDGDEKPSHSRRSVLLEKVRTLLSLGGLAIRRGALRTMQRAGVSYEILKLFSQHKSTQSLKRYLGEAVDNSEEQMREAAKNISAGGPAPSLLDYEKLVKPIHPHDNHRNMGMPSWSEIYATTRHNIVNSDKWPLHLKDVNPIDIPALKKLADKFGGDWRQRLDLALRPLEDPTFYAELDVANETAPKKTCFFNDEEVQQQIDKKLCGVFEGEPKGFVRTFPFEELEKERRRCLQQTVSANTIPRQCSCRLPTMHEVVDSVHKGMWAVTWDFARFFSAFRYAEGIHKYLVFIHKERMLAVHAMAMGQCHSCDLAQITKEIVLQAIRQKIPQAHCLGHIDNGLAVTQTYDDALDVVRELKRICRDLGITINDEETIAPTQEVQFVGVMLNLTGKTVSLAPKSVKKARYLGKFLADNALTLLPVKFVSVVLGLLMFHHHVARSCGTSMASKYYEAVRFGAKISRDAAILGIVVYDLGVRIPENIVSQLRSWLDLLGENTGVRIRNSLDIIDARSSILFVDASGLRWGAVLHVNGKEPRELSGDYPFGFDSRHSTTSEPWAILFAISAMVEENIMEHDLIVASDHHPFVSAERKGLSANPHYNRVISYLSDLPWYPRLLFIMGALNPADEISRGRPLNENKLREAVACVRGTADGWALADAVHVT